MAQAYPRSTFTGYDLAEDATDRARAEAAAWGLTNVSFEVHDVARLPSDPPSTAVSACDAIHDQGDPAGVLSRVRAALEPSWAR
jgi:tRNA/tmRNA/rRNA uracil-C5-methylase (TrmA/RlmC/RlmD family)